MIMKFLKRVPAGMMIVPLLIGAFLNTFCASVLQIGSLTTATFSNAGAATAMGIQLVCLGTTLRFKEIGSVIKRGGVLLIAKFAIGSAIGIVVGKVFGTNGFLGLSALSIICILWIAIIYIISGKLLGIPGNIPPIFFLRIFTSLICIIAIAGFQCMLSLIIRSFAIPVGLAFLCNIFGLLLNLKGLFYATPFSMLIYSMGSTNITGKLNIPLTIVSCLFYVCITFCIGMLYLHKADIKTGR